MHFFVWTLQANRRPVKRGPLAVKFLVGNYQLLLPFRTVVTPKVSFPPEDNFGHASTHWEIQLGKYTLFVHLDALQEPKDFNGFSLMVWRKPADMKPLEINGIRGMVCGDYDSHYWSMWWHLKKGDLMLCITNGRGSMQPGRQENARERHQLYHLRHRRFSIATMS